MSLILVATCLFLYRKAVAQISCDTAESCSGDSIEVNYEMRMHGYKSNYGAGSSVTITSSADSSDRCECRGSFGCNSADFLLTENSDGEIGCFGDSSCTSITDSVTATGEIDCRGIYSCAYTTLEANYVRCSGGWSCVESTITGNGIIEVRGAYAINGATIESDGDIDVLMSGYYSGYGAVVNCNSGDTCIIVCYNSYACDNLGLNCVDGDNCEIVMANECVEDTTIEATATSSIPSSLVIFDSETLSQDYDDGCSLSYDGFQSAGEDADLSLGASDDGNICCRGGESCMDISSMTIENSDYGAVCSGLYACGHWAETTTDITASNVFCSGDNACINTNIDATDVVYCVARGSCEYSSTISNADTLYCVGEQSCKTATVDSVPNIYILAENNDNMTIHSNGIGTMNVHSAYGGLDYGKIYCDEGDTCNIDCSKYRSCGATDHNSLATVFCDGDCYITCDECDCIECPNVVLGTSGTVTYEAVSICPNESDANTMTKNIVVLIVCFCFCMLFV